MIEEVSNVASVLMSFHLHEIAFCGFMLSVTSVTTVPPAEGPADGTNCEMVLGSVSTISKSSSELDCVESHLRLTPVLPSCRNVEALHNTIVSDTEVAADANDPSPENIHSTFASCGK
jgi:hypothetical protein